MSNTRNQGQVGESLTYKRDYLLLARDVLRFYENHDERSQTGKPNKPSSIGLACAHQKEAMLWPNMPIWLITATSLIALAAGGPASVPVLGAVAVFTSLSGVGIQFYRRRMAVLCDIRADFDRQGAAYLYHRRDQLQRELKASTPSRIHASFSRFEDMLSYGARVKAGLLDRPMSTHNLSHDHAHAAPEETPDIPAPMCRAFLATARRMAHIAASEQNRTPVRSRADIVDYAVRATRNELIFLTPHNWPRLVLNRLSRKPRPVTDVTPSLAALPLAREWYLMACCQNEKGYSFARAYDELESRIKYASALTNG